MITRPELQVMFMLTTAKGRNEPFTRYHHEQGLSARKVSLEELFAPSTFELSKI